MKMNRTRSLYISYNGITEPIVRSQVIPYLAALSHREIDFYLVTFEKKQLSAAELTVVRNDLAVRFGREDAIKWFPLKYHKRPSLLAKLLDVITGMTACLNIIRRYGIDVVHARAIQPAAAAFLAAKILGKPFIFDTRGIDSEEYVDAGTWKKGSLIHRMTAFLEDFITRRSDHVVTLTHKFLQILKATHAGRDIKFSVIPCAVDLSLFKRREDPKLAEEVGLAGKFVFVYCGSIGTWYMFDEMCDLFRAAKSLISNAAFLILTQSDAEGIRARCMSRGLNMEDVKIRAVSYDDVPSYLSMAHAGIFFIRPVFSKLSSSPVKFAEYLACGLPVVINKGIGDTDEFTRKHRIGAVVNDFNETEYSAAAGKLLKLIEEEGIRQRCRNAACEELSLDEAVRRYLEIYKGLT